MSKVQARHLERKASVYVRQSSMAQVRNHAEGRERQYDLRDRAVRLGWQPDKVEVIDEDQGRSGSSAEGRSGFQRLVAEVALGEVGAVFGLEVSRLARSCADWYRLLEVAALAKTLIVDEEGVYDPNHYNDRLLLGLKGTLSEAELHFLKSRMIGGRRNKARRAAFRIRLPAGYIWEQGEIRKDPDERVRDTIDLFFKMFERLGSASRVVRFFEDNQQDFPRRDGWGSPGVAVTWGPLSISRAVTVLRSPLYAGIYAYDRNAPCQEDPEDPGAGGSILVSGSHPGYISEEQYESHRSRLTANRSLHGWMPRQGSPREGPSLLQGIALCGRCGKHLMVSYPTATTVSYRCWTSVTHRLCQAVNARHVEPLIEREILEALSREELELAVGTLEKVAQRARELDRQWQKRIESAQYEVDRAARRYHQVEPENRLVARTLEREWNQALEAVESLERKYQALQKTPPFEITDEQRRKIMELSADLPELWKAPTTHDSQRKQIVRLLVEDVTLHNVDLPYGIDVAIRWRTGKVTRHVAERPQRHAWATRPEAVGRIEELLADKDDQEIAQMLNDEGHRTGYDNPFTANRVASVRLRRGLSRLRRTSVEVAKRICNLTGSHSDTEIVELLNQEGLVTAFGKPFSENIVRHIRHSHRKQAKETES